ncbi:hypothetical protein ACWFZ6_18525 [Methylorubrum extorquens]
MEIFVVKAREERPTEGLRIIEALSRNDRQTERPPRHAAIITQMFAPLRRLDEFLRAYGQGSKCVQAEESTLLTQLRFIPHCTDRENGAALSSEIVSEIISDRFQRKANGAPSVWSEAPRECCEDWSDRHNVIA